MPRLLPNLAIVTDGVTGNVVRVRKGPVNGGFWMPSDQMLLAEMEAAVRSFDAGQIRFRAMLDRLIS
jgi:hypothetical protein